MKVVHSELTVTSRKRRDVINISREVEDFVRGSGVRNGLLLIFVPHATAAIFANEDEPLIRRDYEAFFEKIAPEKGEYEHNKIDNNADAHLLSSIFKQFYILPIVNGKVVRGTWQEIFLADFDGPRTRRVVLVAIGE